MKYFALYNNCYRIIVKTDNIESAIRLIIKRINDYKIDSIKGDKFEKFKNNPDMIQDLLCEVAKRPDGNYV